MICCSFTKEADWQLDFFGTKQTIFSGGTGTACEVNLKHSCSNKCHESFRIQKSHTIQRCFHHPLLHLHNLTRALGCDLGGPRTKEIGKLMKIDEICQKYLLIYVSKRWNHFQNSATWLNFLSQFFQESLVCPSCDWIKRSWINNITNLRQNWCHAQCTTSKVKNRSYVCIGPGLWLTWFRANHHHDMSCCKQSVVSRYMSSPEGLSR